MDGGQEGLPPNLADILSTLSRLAPATQQETPHIKGLQDILNAYGNGNSSDAANGGYNPAQPDALGSSLSQAQLSQRPREQTIDPATITEWSSGLRCVTKISSQNPNFGNAIRSMINNQRRNELDWYSKRQELKKTQAQRGSGHTELSSIMQAIGASTDGSAPKQQSPAEMQLELDEFDLKIHRAQSQMHEALVVELKNLGVPFFGTSLDRLVPEDKTSDQDVRRDEGPKWSPRITLGELRTLQQRMISYLEDMYKD